ncbi:competence type IV pilus minor pilin ComGG [Niallia taxi]|uniref:competence type IV pilus minor pilin ComGG n=1 Tax=Niallia taxi TaxID=2499688 RepID=UPI00119DDA79
MRKCQRGFIYPVTLSIFLLFLSCFLVITSLFLTEKRMYHNSKELLVQEYYFMSSVKAVEKELQMGEYAQQGALQLKKGTVDYSIEQTTDTILKVEYRLRTKNVETVGYSYFDRLENKMTKWVEAK